MRDYKEYYNKCYLCQAHIGADGRQEFYKNKEKSITPLLEISDLLKPKKILEIGVRDGTSLSSIMAGSEEVEILVGIDNESYENHSNQLAEFNLKRVNDNLKSNTDINIFKFDTSKEDLKYFLNKKRKTKNVKFDMISIDGDHKLERTLRDMEFAFELIDVVNEEKEIYPVILIDDYKNSKEPDVKKAVDEFVNLHIEDISKHYERSTYRGLYVIYVNKKEEKKMILDFVDPINKEEE